MTQDTHSVRGRGHHKGRRDVRRFATHAQPPPAHEKRQRCREGALSRREQDRTLEKTSCSVLRMLWLRLTRKHCRHLTLWDCCFRRPARISARGKRFFDEFFANSAGHDEPPPVAPPSAKPTITKKTEGAGTLSPPPRVKVRTLVSAISSRNHHAKFSNLVRMASPVDLVRLCDVSRTMTMYTGGSQQTPVALPHPVRRITLSY